MSVRVAMVCSVFPPSMGGIQTHTLRVGQRLVARGAEVLVVTRHHRGLPTLEWMGGVEVVRVGHGDAHPTWATVSYVQGALRVLRARRSRLDVVHTHQLLSPLTVGTLAKAGLGLPLVLNPHACGPIGDVASLRRQGRVGALRLWSARRLADRTVAISEHIHRELVDAGFSDSDIVRIPNGVDVEVFRPPSPTEREALRARLGMNGARVVLFAGRLAKEKGVDVLLRAWPVVALHHPEAQLWLLGEGDEEAALKAQLHALGGECAQRVRWCGPVADVASYLKAADVYVLPSRTEGLPVALLEAMAAGLPIVATRVGGSAEVLEDGRTGRLLPPESPMALALGLDEALGSDEAKGWGLLAREVVQARYGLDEVAGAYEALYAELRREAGQDEARRGRPRGGRWTWSAAWGGCDAKNRDEAEGGVPDVPFPSGDGDVHPLRDVGARAQRARGGNLPAALPPRACPPPGGGAAGGPSAL